MSIFSKFFTLQLVSNLLVKFYIQSSNLQKPSLHKYLHLQKNSLPLLTLRGLGRGRRPRVEYQEGSSFRPNVDIHLLFRPVIEYTSRLCRVDVSNLTSRLRRLKR